MNQETFAILTPRDRGTFREELEQLYEAYLLYMEEHALRSEQLLQVRFFVSDAVNNSASLEESALYKELSRSAAVSFVEQPPLCGCKVAVFLWWIPAREVVKHLTKDFMIMEADGVKYILHNVRFEPKEAAGADSEEQIKRAFYRHIVLLHTQRMKLARNCHRTWIFVRDIDRHYAGVVKGRNVVFASEGLTPDTHFIASTGIGGYPHNAESTLVVEFLSVEGIDESRVKYLKALEYMNPTHEYGVAFERATALEMAGRTHVFVSGTASIDKFGSCCNCGDVEKQADRLFVNIDQVLSDARLSLSSMKYFLVYLRDLSDASKIEKYMSRRFPSTPYILLEARVCRPGWLIEVEGVAVAD